MIKVCKIPLLIISICIIFGFSAARVHAQIPTNKWIYLYSEYSTLNDSPIRIGSRIEVYDPTGVLCGSYFVEKAGSYGPLQCYFDDPQTAIDEGIEQGDTISFKINGLTVGSYRVRESLPVGTTPPVAVPEPTSIVLFGTGISALAAFIHRRQRKK